MPRQYKASDGKYVCDVCEGIAAELRRPSLFSYYVLEVLGSNPSQLFVYVLFFLEQEILLTPFQSIQLDAGSNPQRFSVDEVVHIVCSHTSVMLISFIKL